jgi:hypothetical protein
VSRVTIERDLRLLPVTPFDSAPARSQISRRTQRTIWVVVALALLTAVGGLLQIPGLLS